MKALIGAVVGIIVSFILFFAIYYDQLLAVGRGTAGVLVIMQLNTAQNMFLFGGAIVGAIVGLSLKKV